MADDRESKQLVYDITIVSVHNFHLNDEEVVYNNWKAWL